MNRMCYAMIFLAGLTTACGPSYPSPTTETIGQSGGRIASTDPRLAGTELVIPAGALKSDTAITLEPGADVTTSGQLTLGPAVAVSPDALALELPATMTLPYDPSIAVSSRSVAVLSGGARAELPEDTLTIDANAKTVAFSVDHLGIFEVVGSH